MENSHQKTLTRTRFHSQKLVQVNENRLKYENKNRQQKLLKIRWREAKSKENHKKDIAEWYLKIRRCNN